MEIVIDHIRKLVIAKSRSNKLVLKILEAEYLNLFNAMGKNLDLT